ncbi:PREDICTED: NUAK family SNF1-like kinase 2 [Thamnophis sirtalis]|uniref:non-specific serine/threonine protein kinase n=1 Tax=Thamnophis sirtalis TaxID=35019 RepID=A0A6I9XBB2_9SAUR|nr:PREDICTED: NUAK family SNF1-like kinase 2 [Thamnophis sirtalis]
MERVPPCEAPAVSPFREGLFHFPKAPVKKQAVKRHYHKHNLRHRYEFLETLGKGTYGKVKKARERSGKLVAIKSIRKDKIKDEQDLLHIRREIEIMSSLNHPHIIAVHEVFENSSKIVIVMEYASKGDLYDYISERQRLTEQEARHFFRQVVSAIYYCHKNGIVHRDLKLENILLDANGNIKIADFGLSNVFQQDRLLQTFCGSPLYASPEIVNGRPYKGPEVDSWSLGVLLYILIHGTMPFDSHDYKTLVKQITRGDYKEPTKLSGKLKSDKGFSA